MSRRRVVVTGLGLVSPVGNTVAEGWANLVAGKSGIATITKFDHSALSVHFAGEVKGFDVKQHVPDIDKHEGVGRNTQFAMAACLQAWKAANLNSAQLDLDRVGLYLGSGEGSLDFDAYNVTSLKSWDVTTLSVGGSDQCWAAYFLCR